MSREEAIEFGKMWLQINEDAKDSDTYNFFKFSIKALEQEPILDKLRVEIESYDNFILCANGQKGIHIDKALEIIDKYKAESEVEE